MVLLTFKGANSSKFFCDDSYFSSGKIILERYTGVNPKNDEPEFSEGTCRLKRYFDLRVRQQMQ